MEDQFIKEFEIIDNKLLKDYMNQIRNEIFNGLENLRKRDDKIYERLVFEEGILWNNLKNNFKELKIDKSEEVKRLTKLFEIYGYLSDIFSNNRWSIEHLNNLKYLIKE